MALDLNEVAQSFLRANTNIDNVFNKFYDMYYNPTPMDITISYVNPDGTVTDKVIPNRMKIREQIWADAQSAMSKTYYVDAVNGSDANDGLTETTPFQTLQKAIDSVPVGGIGVINLLNDYNLTSDITINNKVINIQLSGFALNLTTDSTSKLNKFYTDVGGSLIIDGGGITTSKIVLPAPTSDTTNISVYPSLFSSNENGVGNLNLVITNSVEVVINSTSYFLLSLNNLSTASVIINATLTDNTGAGITWGNLINGIVFDANGVPRNVISNIIL